MIFLNIHNAMQQKDKDWQSKLKYKHPLIFKYFSKLTKTSERGNYKMINLIGTL